MLRLLDAREQRRARRELVAERAAEREAAGRNTKRQTRFRRFRRRLGGMLVPWLAPRLLRLMACTWRVERTGPGRELFDSESPWITTLWHGRMLAMMPLRGHIGRNIGVLVSPSDDGGLAKTALQKFRCQVVRGSLSRRGATAMREMLELVQGGGQLVLTPDGPRGPRHSVNSGAAWLARATGVPIVPLAVGVTRAWRLRSWDRMCIPKPFARVVVHYGNPIHIAADVSDDELERISAAMRDQMIATERDAFQRLGVTPDFAAATE